MDNNVVETKRTIGEILKANRGIIIKVTLGVTAVVGAFAAAKYLTAKGAEEVLELATNVADEASDVIEVVAETVNT